MGLETLLLDSGLKLAMGEWIAWWTGLPGRTSRRRGTLYVVLTYSLWEDFKVIIWGPSHRALVGTIFYLGNWPLETPSKDLHLAIGGGLGWMKKIGQKKVLYFMQFFFCTIFFLVKILLAKLKNLYIQYAWISIMTKQNSNQNVKFEKMVVPVKTWLLPSQVWL